MRKNTNKSYDSTLNTIVSLLADIASNQRHIIEQNNHLICCAEILNDELKIARVDTDKILDILADKSTDEQTVNTVFNDEYFDESTTKDDVLDAIKEQRIAIYCANQKEWDELIFILDNAGYKAADGKEMFDAFHNNYCDRHTTLAYYKHIVDSPIGFIKELLSCDGVCQGTAEDFENKYAVIKFSTIRHLFAKRGNESD
jgi:hypothetical protein